MVVLGQKSFAAVGGALSAVGVFGCQQVPCRYSWTLWLK